MKSPPRYASSYMPATSIINAPCNPGAQEAVHCRRGDVAREQDALEVAVYPVVCMQFIGQVELQWCIEARLELAQANQQNGRVSRPMPDEALEITKQGRPLGGGQIVGAAEDGTRLPQPVKGNRRAQSRDQREGVRRCQSRQIAGCKCAEHVRRGRDGIPECTQAPRHQLLLAD